MVQLVGATVRVVDTGPLHLGELCAIGQPTTAGPVAYYTVCLLPGLIIELSSVGGCRLEAIAIRLEAIASRLEVV